MQLGNIDAIKEYWDEQARKLGSDPRGSTQDYWMREVEIDALGRIMSGFEGSLCVLDIGCGNGFSTIRLLQQHPQHSYIGGDYSAEMIRAAHVAAEHISPQLRDRIRFEELDVLDLRKYSSAFNLVISDRCLINLPGRELQWKAVREIWNSLKADGHFIAIENFLTGQANLNEQRRKLGLSSIKVRWHNCFLDEDEFVPACSSLFEIADFIPISSTYYLVTRLVYSKLCQLEGREPDYDHPIYSIASQLPSVGDFGPIKLVHMRKKESGGPA